MRNNTHKERADFIWKVCDLLRGHYKRNEYRKVILPLVVLTRFDTLLKSTKENVIKEYDELKGKSENILAAKIKLITKLDFYNVSKLDMSKLLNDPNQIAQNLISYINGFSPNIRGIMDRFRFDAQIEKMNEKDILYKVIQKFVTFEEELGTLNNEDMGYIFEEIIRIGAEQANEEAGEHFTPREVIKLMVYILLSPQNRLNLTGKVKKFYDPACGTGGMLSMGDEYIKSLNGEAIPKLFGQDMNDEAWAVCCSDMLIKGHDVENIKLGDTFRKDGFKGEKFDYMLANPPFGVSWEQQRKDIEDEWATLGFNGRFGAGTPRINDGSLLFLQHMISKMYNPKENGGDGSRIAVIFNGAPLFNGDAGGGESEIRRWIIENDYLEAVIALPDALFYNTGISTYLWILSNNKEVRRKDQIQLIDARKFWAKMEPKSLNFKRKRIPNGDGRGPGDYISAITEIYDNFTNNEERTVTNPDDGTEEVIVSKIFPNEYFAYYKISLERPLRLNFCANTERINRIDNESGFISLTVPKRKDRNEKEKEIELGILRQEFIKSLLNVLAEKTQSRIFKDRKEFLMELRKLDKELGIKLTALELKAILSALSERDETAEPCTLPDGSYEPDSALSDAEQVPILGKINGYKSLVDRSKAGLIDNIQFKEEEKEIIKKTVDQYVKDEVKPHLDDAWVDDQKTKIGYELPFIREFFIYQPPRELAEIVDEIKSLEKEIMDLL